MPFFSIIMPAFNAEKHLEEAIDSVVKQSFPDFELIVVNDGSCDHTKDICQRWMKKDARVQFIDKMNAGVAAARNDALDVAKGVFIMFVDSDDVIYPHSLQTLYEVLSKTPYDYLRFEYQTIDEVGKNLYPNYEAKKRKKFSGKCVDAAKCIQQLVRGEFFSCVGTYKRSVIENNQLRFMMGCTYNEDTLFMMEYFTHSKTHSYVSDVMYGYRKTGDAVTSKFTERNYQDVKRVVEKMILMIPCENLPNKIIKRTIESLSIRLILLSKDTTSTEYAFCINRPIMLEWKVFKFLGLSTGIKTLPVLNVIKKIIRKLYK